MAVSGYLTSRKTRSNQWLATYKQEIHLWAQISQGERKSLQMEDTHDNLSVLMTYLLFYV